MIENVIGSFVFTIFGSVGWAVLKIVTLGNYPRHPVADYFRSDLGVKNEDASIWVAIIGFCIVALVLALVFPFFMEGRR